MQIKILKYEFNRATVKYIPNRLQKFMGMKEKEIKFAHCDERYVIDDNLKWYYLNTAKVRGRFKRLDEYIRMQKFKY